MDDVFNSDVGLDGPGLQFPGRPIIALSETNSQMPFQEIEKEKRAVRVRTFICRNSLVMKYPGEPAVSGPLQNGRVSRSTPNVDLTPMLVLI